MNTQLVKYREQSFVEDVINSIEADKRKAASFRRADNPALEYQSWEYMARFGVNLENPHERAVFGLIAAAVAKQKIKNDGSMGIGEAIAHSYESGNQSDQAKSKLRRLLSCDSTDELCDILRPILQLIGAKKSVNLCYSKLLNELIYFECSKLRIKTKWANNFYRHKMEEE